MPGRSDIKAGGAYVELTLKNSAFLKGLRGALAHLASFAKGFAIAGAAGISAGVATAPRLVVRDQLLPVRVR